MNWQLWKTSFEVANNTVGTSAPIQKNANTDNSCVQLVVHELNKVSEGRAVVQQLVDGKFLVNSHLWKKVLEAATKKKRNRGTKTVMRRLVYQIVTIV